MRADLIARCKTHGLAIAEGVPWQMGDGAVESRASRVEDVFDSSIASEGPCLSVPSVVGKLHEEEKGNNPRPANPSLSAALDPPPSTLDPRATPVVFFPGFRQIEELPQFYARAGCFVHPALEEPWGLVLNEASASGLPILAGDNVGAAEELVEDGVNGWKFDAQSVDSISENLKKMATLSPDERDHMGKESFRILQECAPTKAFGEGLAKLLGVK